MTASNWRSPPRTWPGKCTLTTPSCSTKSSIGTTPRPSTAIIWLDDVTHTAEFEPVGTHQEYRRQGLGSALLTHGMQLARAAGADQLLVACLGAAAYPAARDLYSGVGFRKLTCELPHVKRVG
ncbi:MAG: GNAT family N-acetyltransferase [Nakamurella sp.]